MKSDQPIITYEWSIVHPMFIEADRKSKQVIGAAIEVHREMGPGLLESIYERCLKRELELRELTNTTQKSVDIRYKDIVFEETLRCDMLVDSCLLVEIKSVQEILPIHKAQLLSYMKLMNIPLGLLINFNEERLVDGLHRLVLPGAGLP